MRNKSSVEQLLKTYEVAQPEEKQIVECMKYAKNAMQIKRVRHDDSLWFFLETQMKFMTREIIFSFFISLAVMFLLQISKLFSRADNLMAVSVGVAPFLVVPIIISVVKSKNDGMLELETASRFGLQKILAARTIINQALAILMITFIWLVCGIGLNDFSTNRLFFSLISFEITSICFLWFGKSSAKTGGFFATGWMVAMLIFLSWEKAVRWMEAVNSVALFLITAMFVGAGMMAIYVHMKNISFESEETKWNLGWID